MKQDKIGEGPSIDKVEHSMPQALQKDFTQKQSQFAPPMRFPTVTPHGNAAGEVYTPLPAQYAQPSEDRERFMFKRKLMANPEINAVNGQGQVQWNVSDGDMKVMQDLEASRRMYDYHSWLDKNLDPRKPGNLDWIMRIEPDYIKMKMKALNAQMELFERRTKLEAFGPQNQEDMRLKYLIDNNMLTDGREPTTQNRYVSGFLRPEYNLPTHGTNSSFTEVLWPSERAQPANYNYMGGVGVEVPPLDDDHPMTQNWWPENTFNFWDPVGLWGGFENNNANDRGHASNRFPGP